MTERDIIHENGNFWVGRTKQGYTVFKTGATHSTSNSTYALTDDGKSIAIARCNYLAKRQLAEAEALNGSMGEEYLVKPVCPKKLKALVAARIRTDAIIGEAMDKAFAGQKMTATVGKRVIPVAIGKSFEYAIVSRKDDYAAQGETQESN